MSENGYSITNKGHYQYLSKEWMSPEMLKLVEEDEDIPKMDEF